jgi:hypothetical protein
MHKARHTAGQRVLDKTGNLKAVQKLLGHASIQTTGDVSADWDIDQLARRWPTSQPKRTTHESFPPFPRALHIAASWRRRESNPRPRSRQR